MKITRKTKKVSAWNKFKAEKNKTLCTLFAVVAMLVGTFAIGAIVNPKSGAGASGCAAMSMVLLPFAKRQGSNFKMYRTQEEIDAAGNETADERKARIALEQKGFIETITKQVNTLIEKKTAGLDNMPVEFKAIKDELDALKAADKKDLTELKSLLSAQGLEIKAFKEKSKDKPEYKSWKQEFMGQLMEKKDAFLEAYQNRAFNNGAVVIELKSVVTEMDSTTIGSGSTNYSLTTFTGLISKIRKRLTKYLDFVSSGTIGSPVAYWIEETTEAGTPIFIGEGDAKTQLSVLYVEKTAQVRKIAVFGKMSWEWMKDLPQLMAYFQNNLIKRLDIKTEDQLISGNGTGNELIGINLNATAFSAGALLNTITDANAFDVIRAVALQVELGFGDPTGIFVNPTTIAKMELAKTSLGQYVMPPFATANGKTVANMTVISTTAMGVDDFVGGDLSVMNVLFADGLTIRIGETGNDLTSNLKTIVLEQRLVQYISANDYQVIVKGTFTNAIAQLDGSVSQ